MIYGIGTDICDIRRIRSSLERHGERFAHKVLHEAELGIWHSRSARWPERGVFVYVSGGMLEVQPTLVTVLADTAIRAHDLDEARALEAKKAAEELLKNRDTSMDYAKAEAELADAIGQLAAIKKLRNKH